ncbi:hypothetical protein FB45DRAFT_122993 [Roridomyces roridus]|uniref:Uncharacterized protein n=1 Tax=Roridomyces roridus TaxID=1738132 RepID=A0AAD7BIF5_9AGAR|nr:hypothetical protein FB45DRAFT_122993 [Roridomyces roridus]
MERADTILCSIAHPIPNSRLLRMATDARKDLARLLAVPEERLASVCPSIRATCDGLPGETLEWKGRRSASGDLVFLLSCTLHSVAISDRCVRAGRDWVRSSSMPPLSFLFHRVGTIPTVWSQLGSDSCKRWTIMCCGSTTVRCPRYLPVLAETLFIPGQLIRQASVHARRTENIGLAHEKVWCVRVWVRERASGAKMSRIPIYYLFPHSKNLRTEPN